MKIEKNTKEIVNEYFEKIKSHICECHHIARLLQQVMGKDEFEKYAGKIMNAMELKDMLFVNYKKSDNLKGGINNGNCGLPVGVVIDDEWILRTMLVSEIQKVIDIIKKYKKTIDGLDENEIKIYKMQYNLINVMQDDLQKWIDLTI